MIKHYIAIIVILTITIFVALYAGFQLGYWAGSWSSVAEISGDCGQTDVITKPCYDNEVALPDVIVSDPAYPVLDSASNPESEEHYE